VARIRNLRFDSWRDFKRDIVAELFPGESQHRRGVYLFRGMQSPRWRLEPSFDRAFGDVPAAERPALFDALLATFRADCRDFGVPADVCDDDHRLIALGQHHGLPTRLLDWTISPYVAAWFAYADALDLGATDSHVVVWALDLRSVLWKDENVEIIWAPSHYNARARNQFGCFTLSRGPHACLEDLVADGPGDDVALIRVYLPAADTHPALADLDLMGINALRLFPDLGGVATACATQLRLDL
jgi:hypothetical protein